MGGICHNDSRTPEGKNKDRNGHFDMMSVAMDTSRLHRLSYKGYFLVNLGTLIVGS